MNLDEIARLAGVSRATASRVLNNRPHVRQELRERVKRVIEETGYQPHPAARSLAFQRSGIIGLVLPRNTESFFADPYFPSLIQAIAYECNENDYVLSLFLLQTKEDEDKLYPRLSQKGLLDGLIVQVGEFGDCLVPPLAEDGDIPFVVAGRPMTEVDVNYVDVDNVAGAYNAVTHLIQMDRKRVATITGPLNTAAGTDRKRGYERALKAHGVDLDEALIAFGDFTGISSYYAMKRLLKHRPDAVFVASDSMALEAMRAIREAGLSIPEDIAIVGYDDLPPATRANPPLTTVRQPIHRCGIALVDVLLDVIENGQEHTRQVVYDTELIVRSSCGAYL